MTVATFSAGASTAPLPRLAPGWVRPPARHADLLRQAVRFLVVGSAGTSAYLAVYLLLGTVAGAQLANAAAVVATTAASTEANRRWTFTSSAGALRAQVQSTVVIVVNTALTASALDALHTAVPAPSQPLELAVLLTAGAVGGVLRFTALRTWVFRAR